MRIFVTGGSGYIGRGVLRALAKAGHRMIGLARSDGAAKVLRKLGADVVLGDLAEPERWRSQVRGHDAALHLAMVQGKAAAEIDWRTVEVLLKEALSERGPSHVIYTSGVMVLGDTGNAAAGEEARTSSAAVAVAPPSALVSSASANPSSTVSIRAMPRSPAYTLAVSAVSPPAASPCTSAVMVSASSTDRPSAAAISAFVTDIISPLALPRAR